MKRARVFVVDDSVVIRKVVGDVITEDADLELAGVAANGQIALTKIERLRPDIITLDVEMPVMGGLETLAALRKSHPDIPVIMFSAATAKGAATTLDALSMGARDYALKPSAKNFGQAKEQLRSELLIKIKHVLGPQYAAGPADAQPTEPLHAVCKRPALHPTRSKAAPEIVAVGVSTGGPTALEALLPKLPGSFPIPIVITQHMPPVFTRSLADRLNTKCEIQVAEGEDGMPVEAGHAYIAPGSFHMTLEQTRLGRCLLRLNEEPPENFCRPSVDPMFRSVAQIYRNRALGVMLTGMGRDGLQGTSKLVDEGSWIIAQDEASSVVWGMPGFVVKAGYADEVLPLDQIATAILTRTARAPQAVPSA